MWYHLASHLQKIADTSESGSRLILLQFYFVFLPLKYWMSLWYDPQEKDPPEENLCGTSYARHWPILDPLRFSLVTLLSAFQLYCLKSRESAVVQQ